MDTLLIGIYEQFESLYQDKGVCLKLNLPGTSLPRMCGNRNRLEQIFAVLLNNALRYTPRDRSVSLATSVQTDKHLPSRGRSIVCLTVSDQDCGMDGEIEKHILNRFHRGDSARSHKQNYEPGLSIAKELVQLHKGTISVSDSPDGGTCFLVRLPAEPESYTSGR